MSFSRYHPAVNIIFFTAVLLFGMFIMHPVFLGIALLSSAAYSIVLNGKKAIRFNFLYMMPMLIFMAMLNPLFNRGGETVLFTAFGGVPFTLESMLYGAASASMFVSVICWFSCCNTVMTSDKIHFLFSRFSPSLSLMFSMTLRFIPRMKTQLKAISNAQRCIGRDVSDGTFPQRIRHGMRILSALATWALENAVETADSMKSRGYGLPGRSSFSVFRFDGRDRIAVAYVLILSAIIAACIGSGSISIAFYPAFKASPASPMLYVGAVCYLLLCATPLILEELEALSWKRSESRI